MLVFRFCAPLWLWPPFLLFGTLRKGLGYSAELDPFTCDRMQRHDGGLTTKNSHKICLHLRSGPKPNSFSARITQHRKRLFPAAMAFAIGLRVHFASSNAMEARQELQSRASTDRIDPLMRTGQSPPWKNKPCARISALTSDTRLFMYLRMSVAAWKRFLYSEMQASMSALRECQIEGTRMSRFSDARAR